MTITAQELLVEGSRPRRLRCCALLSQIALQNNKMTLEGRDGEVSRFSTLSDLAPGEGIIVTYLSSGAFASLLRPGDDVAVITRPELHGLLQPGNIALTVEGDPHDEFYSAFSTAVENGSFEELRSFVSPSAKIHPVASVSDHVHIEAGAVIGAGAVVLANTYVGPDVTIKPNATVGGDGFENAVIRGRRMVVPHAGEVWLSEGVQVGSSTCIDRGLFGDFSYLGTNTTVDNLVHFAHSAKAGKDCALVACSEISGGVVLGDGVWLGPNVSINQGLNIGDHCYVGTGAVVTRDLPPHSLAYGSPAKAMAQVCVCRAKIKFENGMATCDRCLRKYNLSAEGTVQHA